MIDAPATVKAMIDGREVEVPAGTTILDAARMVHVKIPVLCKHPDLDPTASCGLCVVKVEGSRKLPRACCTPIEPNMKVHTQDPELTEVRRTVLEMILSKHPNECYTCGRNLTCELQARAAEFGIRRVPFANIVPDLPKDDSTRAIVLDPRKCINCGRCVHVCQDLQDVWALSFLDRGFDIRISPAGEVPLASSPCVRCGQCAAHCPTGAIVEYDEVETVWAHLRDSKSHNIVQIAPAIRTALGEAFNMPPGTNLTGKIYSALRRLGFKGVFDTSFGADLTIMEEANEFADRFANHPEELPLITSCCPAWTDYMEKYYGDMIPHFSTAKSPHEMLGVLAKTYYPEKNNVDPATVYSVSIMPCSAKKYEIQRAQEMYASGYQDIDVVLTTREFARMIQQSGLWFDELEESEPDHLLGEYSGAGVLFGTTGGVMEAALRTAYSIITKTELPEDALEFHEIRGLKGVKTAEIMIGTTPIRVAVAHGLAHVKSVMDAIRQAKEEGKETPYHFIEVMACPGGCVGGGGQPYYATNDTRAARAAGLYSDDRSKLIRRSHDNPFIQKLYAEYLDHPLSEKAHKLLHTHYTARPLYQR